MHTTHVQAPTPARRTTIFSRTRSLLRIALAASFMLCFTTVANAQWTDSNTGVTFTPVSGSTTGGEGYDKGCDGNTGTKHGGQPGNLPHYLVVQASQEVLLTGYTITTANDNASYTGRSPYTWKIQGSNTNNGSDWVDIASVTNDNVIQNVNYTEYTFSCSTSKYYTYFRFYITAINGGNYMQYSEFHPIGEVRLDPGTSGGGGSTGPTSVGYVITNGSVYLGGTSTTPIDTFNPQTCLWTGTSGGTWRNSAGYYLQMDRNNFTLSSTTSVNLTLQGTESGTTGQKIYNAYSSDRYYYLRYNNGWAKGDRQRTASTTETLTTVVFAVTKTTYNASYTVPAIGGATVVSSLGSNNINTIATAAAYTQKYYNYIFRNNTNHYVDDDDETYLGSTNNDKPSASTFTYTWSLDGISTDYATINETTGVISYNSSVSSDVVATVTLTASSTKKTFVVTKDVTFKVVPPTSITPSTSNITVYVGNTGTVTYSLSPTGAYHNVSVSSGNNSIATAVGNNAGTVTITPVSVGNTTVTLSAARPGTTALTAEVNVAVKNKVTEPVIQFDQIGEGATATASISCPTNGATIYYTHTRGGQTIASGTYSTSFTVNEYDQVEAYASMVGNDLWDNSETITETYVSCTTQDPIISYTPSGSTATVTITAESGATIYYTTNGDNPKISSNQTGTTSVTINNVNGGTTIKAYAKKGNCSASEVVSKEIITTGASGGVVTLYDYEDHTWTYYSGIDASVDGGNYNTNYAGKMYSPNPRNVKITYNGVNGIANSTITVKVSRTENETSFVYYKTLEESSTSGEYKYQVISNPFSVRPSTGTGNNKRYYGFAGWKIVSGGSYIKGKSDGDVLGLDEEITFNNLPYPSVNCTSAEIVFETTWTQANVQTGNNISTMLGNFNGGTYETNFAVLTGDYTTAWTGNKNATITSVLPDGSADYRGAYTRLNVTVNSGYTIKYEYININNNNSTFTMGTGTKTLYIGRGVSNTTAGSSCCNLIQGCSGNITGGLTYTLKIESGVYGNISYTRGLNTSQNASISGTVNIKSTLGCDYDRAKNNNENLKFTNEMWFGDGPTLSTPTSGTTVFTCFVKSGTMNSSLTDAGIGDAQNSFYVGIGANYSPGHRHIEVEGGMFWSLAGGLDDNDPTDPCITYRIRGGTFKGAIYGSAANATANGIKQMIFTGGTIQGWIGAGANGTANNGGKTNGISYVYIGGRTQVVGNNDTYINGSVGGNVFGAGSGSASYTAGEMTEGSNVVVADEAYVKNNVYGGGNFGFTDKTATVYITGGTIDGSVFGGANQNKGDYTKIVMTGGLVKGGVYGGCNTSGTIGYNVTMNINGGQVGTPQVPANIHGGGYGSSTRVTRNVELTLGTTTQTTPGVTVYGDVYGGSALGYVNGTSAADTYHTYVTLNKGTINGSLYGGGLGNNNTAANVYGPVKVTVNGGSVNKTDANGANGSGAVYGCNNINGAPQRAVDVIINGTDPAPSADTYALFAVYGGGNKANYTYGTPTVTVNNCDNSIEYVYGGGNAAHITNGNTDVKIYGGNKIGNVFGGGNGTVTAANVSGNTSVNIYGGTIGRVFGGSNSAGTIGGSLNVNVEKDSDCAIKIGGVYSGGNKAASNLGTITVGCMDTADMIDSLFCGANQANVTGNVDFTMKGGRINNLFGGNNQSGNVSGSIKVTVDWSQGSCSNNYLGNVFGGGNLATFGTAQNPKAPTVNIYHGTVSGNVYGGGKGDPDDHTKGQVTGDPSVTIGDKVDGHMVTITGSVFGGGDAGNVVGTPVVKVEEKCNTAINTAVYGGGNAADVSGTNVTIYGGTIGDVFGGGNGAVAAANVTGATSLTIHGGTITRVFAGGNTAGTIGTNSGVTIDHSSSCDQSIAEVYGGGNLAAGNAGTVTIQCSAENIGDVYGGANQADISNDITLNITGGQINNVFGGNNTSGSINGGITVNINKDASCNTFSVNNVYGGGNLAQYSIPNNKALAVNILNGTVSQNVYGGGKGDPADHTKGQVTGNPVVTIGDANNLNNDNIVATVTGDVYGGGDAGNVVGTPVVNVINKCNTTIGNVYGGGNAADVNGTDVNIDGGTITGMVFGGGHGDKDANPQKQADVNGNVAVDITGGTIAKVFGGSNSKGNITGTVAVNIDKGDNSCDLHIDEVYGGGNQAAGNAGTITIGCTGTATEGIGDVYGGAREANINSDITLNISGGKINNVFGGNNISGSISGGIEVNISWDGSCAQNSIQNVYGGGNLAQYTIPDSKALAVNILNGTVSQNVYGGGKGDPADHTKGQVTGNPVVTIGDATKLNDNNVTAIVNGDVYGGGDAGNVVGTPQVNVINKCNTTIGNVYGGGNAADVNGTDVNIDGGTITGMVFGGGHGDKTSDPQKEANVNGNVAVDITGGTINKVFGGSNSKGNITGTVAVNIAKGANSCDMHITEVYGGGNEAAGNAGTLTIGCTGDYDTNVEGITNVYGGANAADVGNNINLTINGGHIDNVYGGNNTSGSISGTITVNVNWNDALTCDKYLGNVFGGGNQAVYTAPTGYENYPAVNILKGTVSGDVFGGGYGNANDATKGVVNGNPQVTINGTDASVVGGVYGGGSLAPTNGNPVVTLTTGSTTNIYGGGKAANVNGAPTVNVNGGTVSTGVYGGCNTSGAISGNIAVNLNGGTIGTSGSTPIPDIVFGGGYGESTSTAGNITLAVNGSTIHGNVYGGSALGSVNDAAADATTVNVLAGTVNGNIYGGGLGEAGAANVAKGQVNGTVTVNIGSGTVDANTGFATATSGTATINGSVYGCNNTNGSPKANVYVNVYQTAHSEAADGYAIDQVFGGGNQADYSPTSNDSRTTVHVYTCDNTIRRVFAGGNAAAAIGVANIIDGGRFEYVYGGGNGEIDPADIGAGGTDLKVHGGDITYLFGGSNHSGTITGQMRVSVDGEGACGQDMFINEFFCGNNEAPINTSIVATIGCGTKFGDVYGGCNQAEITGNVTLTIEGGEMNNVYGGSKGDLASLGSGHTDKAANINGNVTLNITGGTIGNAFGGSNINGNITGSIQVNVEKAADPCSWSLGNVYGASNLAAYTPTNAGSYPEVNIKNGEITNSVYGGGKGSTAVVTSNPIVTVTGGTITQDVFGGGEQAPVVGNPTVLFTGGQAANVYGGGKQANVTGDNTVRIEGGTVTTDVYGGGMQGDVSGNVTVNISSDSYSGTENVVTINGDVYGGGALANTNTGNIDSETTMTTDRNVTVVNLYPGATIGHDVYGGGRGQKADNTTQPATNAVEAVVYGDVTVTQYGSILTAAYDNEGLASGGRIFGGNNVNGTPKGHILVYVVKTTGTTGQQRSSDDDRADADATHTYELAAVYGGGNEAEYNPYEDDPDDPKGFAEVIINGCNDVSIHSVYGGGNAASTPATMVTIDGAYEIEFVFGGGNGAGTGNPGANVGYHAYGDDHAGITQADIDYRMANYQYGTGVAATNIYGGRIHNIYGGSNTRGNVRETAIAMLDEVNNCPLVVDGIYGGGREAYMEGGASLELGCITQLTEIYGGSEKADVGSSVELTITSGHFDRVFGGNNKSGKILGSITVNIEQTGCVPITIDELYLGGNNAPYSVYGYEDTYTEHNLGTEQNQESVKHYDLKHKEDGNQLYNDPVLNIRSFKSIGTVYGGGKGEYATMVGDPTVDINVTHGWVNGEYVGTVTELTQYKGAPAQLAEDGVIGTVFGGGNAATVDGSPKVKIGDKLDTSVELKSMRNLFESIGDQQNNDHGDIRITKDGTTGVTYTNKTDGTKTLTETISQTVNGATITGNVYGGGNQAAVTGNTDIQVGPTRTSGGGQPSPAPQRTEQPAAQTDQPAAPAQTQPASQTQNAATEAPQGRAVTPTRL